jgi:hypothetical protein
MAEGKPAGTRCAQLSGDFRCAVFASPERPRCCSGLRPSIEMCGGSREEALAYLDRLERLTASHGA